MKNKLALHEIVLFGIALLLVLWKLLVGGMRVDLSLLWWLLGMVCGFLFIFLDRFIYSLYSHKEEPLSMKIRELFRTKRYSEGVSFLLNERQEQKELVMRSFLFIGVWVIMSVFTLTSSTNFFARGLMLGIGTHLVFDLSADFFWNKTRFDYWFWQIKRKIGNDEKKWFFGLSILIYVLLATGL